MRHPSTILTAICLIWATPASTEPALGVWKSEPGETGGYIHVEIMPCENNLCGIITEVVGNDNRSHCQEYLETVHTQLFLHQKIPLN